MKSCTDLEQSKKLIELGDRNMKRIICEGESHVDACVDMKLKLHDQELL